MKTLLLNPLSFENLDGGAGSRWPATREITLLWYPQVLRIRVQIAKGWIAETICSYCALATNPPCC
jgi:hypothetical protein